MAKKFGNGKPFKGTVKHQAFYNGRQYNLSSTDWSRMIDCPVSQVERGLRKHYSMQAYIDECHSETQKHNALWRKFIFSGMQPVNGNG